MTSETREITINISESNIKDQIAALLYATKVVFDNEEITDLQIGEPFVSADQKKSFTDMMSGKKDARRGIPITLKIKANVKEGAKAEAA